MSDDEVVEIDGKHYHWREGRVLRYSDGSPIPAHVCLCSAHSANECCCGAWDREIEDES